MVAAQDICGGGTGYVVEELELMLALQLWLRAWQFNVKRPLIEDDLRTKFKLKK